MKHAKQVIAPLVIAAIAILTLSTGVAVASHKITGKDIKNHSIGYVDLSKSAVNKLAKPAPGAAETHSYAGHIAGLNTGFLTEVSASPVGYSTTVADSPDAADILGPSKATTLTGLTVHIQNPPGGTAVRKFILTINNSPVTPCIISGQSLNCHVNLDVAVPANATIYLQSDVVEEDAAAADAAFAWSTKG